jgi:endoglucanase
VCSTSFYLKTLPLFDGGDDVGMVLSPQCFHNLNMHADIFNHSNVHFWECVPGC